MKKMKRNRLQVEVLESRSLLAGNVLAYVDGDVLRIIGDDAHNWVEIQQMPTGPETKTFKIIGGSYSGAIAVDPATGRPAQANPATATSPTKINGAAEATLSIPSGKIYISTGKGNDVIILGDNSSLAASSLTVYGGPNRDYLEVNKLTATDSALISMGLDAEADVDTVKINIASIAATATIRTGGGNDAVTATQLSADNVAVETSLGNDAVTFSGLTAAEASLETSDGDDVITAAGLAISQELEIASWVGNDTIRLGDDSATSEVASLIAFGGPGADSFEGTKLNIASATPAYTAAATIVLGADSEVDVDTVQLRKVDVPNQGATIRTGDGADFIFTQQCAVAQDLLVESGNGDDIVTALNLSVLGLTTVRLGEGNDSLDVSDSTFQGVSLDGNGGNDRISLTRVTATSAVISLYTGDDTLNLVSNVVVGSVNLYGGPGYDTLTIGPGLSIGSFAGNGFENPAF